MGISWYQWTSLPAKTAIEDAKGCHWEGYEQIGSVPKPFTCSCAEFVVLRSLCTVTEVQEIIDIGVATLDERVQEGLSQHIDTVDGWPTFEWHPMAYGGYDQRMENVLRPIVEQRLTPYIRRRFNEPGAVACTALFRRYEEEERRVHPVHFDHQSFATVVVGLNPGEFQGGLFVQGDITRDPQFIDLRLGDAAVHQYDLHHGVAVVQGKRYSLIFWFMDSWQACLKNTRFWYKKSAEAGVPDAMCNWAVCLEQGDGSGQPPSLDAAMSWYRRAISLGHLQAMNNVAKLLWEGSQLPADPHQALDLWQRSALGGYTTAQRNLGSIFLTGHGGRVPVDVCEGIRLLKLAAGKGDIEAMFKLGYHGRATCDPGLTCFLKKAADMGHPYACLFLAEIYRTGEIGFPCDVDTMLRYLRWSAHLGIPQAINDLGLLYCSGALVDRNGALGATLLRKAAELNNASGQMNLALCYQRGVGVDVDLEKALFWCRQAATQQHNMAMAMLPDIEAAVKRSPPRNDQDRFLTKDHSAIGTQMVMSTNGTNKDSSPTDFMKKRGYQMHAEEDTVLDFPVTLQWERVD